MQPRNTVPLQSSKQPQAKKSTVLHKVARRILAPIRSIPLPSSPTHSRTPSASSTSGLRTTQTPPTTIVQMVPSGPRSQLPPVSLKKYNKSQHHVPTFPNNCGGVFVFPVPAALPSSAAPAPASPTSTIHMRRGAIVELPNEWYAKAEGYNALGVVRTRSRDGTKAERIRRVKSFTGTARSVGASLFGGVRRGKSAQAALGVSAPPASTPALVDEREQERDTLDWGNSIGLSDDLTISFDFEDELDADLDEV